MASINTNLSALDLALIGRSGVSSLAGSVPTPLSASVNAMSRAVPGVDYVGSVSSRSQLDALNRQRFIANVHLAQSALDAVQRATQEVSDHLLSLRKLALRASDQALAGAERTLLNTKYQKELSSLQTLISSSRWNGQRLFDGTAGDKRDGLLSFAVGDNRTIDITLPNLKKASRRMITSELVAGSLGPGVREIQTIELGSATVADMTAELSFNGITLNSGALGANASIDDLVAALTSDTDYAGAGFTLAHDGGTALQITGQSSVNVSGTASLTLTRNPSVVDAIVTTGGANAQTIAGTAEQQSISLLASAIQSKTATLTVGSTVLSAGTMASNATLDDLVTGLQSDADYSAAGFTVSNNGNTGLLLQWLSVGAVSQLGVLSLESSSSTMALQASAGTNGSYQYETYAIAGDSHLSGATSWSMTSGAGGDKTNNASNISFNGTLSGLVTSINSSTVGNEVIASSDSSGLKLTWKTTGNHVPKILYIFNPSDGRFTVGYAADTSVAQVAAASEVQEFSLSAADIQGKPVSVSFGGATYTTPTLSSTATMSDLVSALNTAASGAPFTVSEITAQNSSVSTGYTSGIRLSWNATGSITTAGTSEQQTFQISATDLRNADKVTLSYGASSFTAQLPYGATTTWWSRQNNLNSLSDAATGLNTQIAQAASSPGFTVSTDTSNGLTLVWNSEGNQSGTASLSITRNAQTADYTGNTVWNFNGWLYPEVHQSWSFIDTTGLSGYRANLVFGSTVLSSDPLTGSETATDGNYEGYQIYQQLAADFMSDPDYSSIADISIIHMDPWNYGAPLSMDWSAAQASFPTAYLDFYRNLSATETVTGAAGTSPRATITLPDTTTTLTASQTTAGAAAASTPAVNEIQQISIEASTIQGKNVTLSWGAQAVSATSLASNATVDDLLASLAADSAYGDMPFTITASTSGASGAATDTLILSWKSSGAVNQNAFLSIADPSFTSLFNSTETRQGEEPSVTGGLSELQRIYVRPSTIGGHNMRLSLGDFSMYSGMMEEGASLSDLVFGLVSNPSYDRAPFTVSQQGTYLELSWKVAGPVTQTAQLQSNAAGAMSSYLKKDNLLSREASLSALAGLGYAQQSLSDLQASLQPVGTSLLAAIDQLSTEQNRAASGSDYNAGFASALVGLLQTQFASDPGKSAVAQANFTPSAVINTLR